MKSIGIDYHKRYSVVCVLDNDGRDVTIERIEHVSPERFHRLIGSHAPCQVAFESTMNWGWLYDLLEVIPGVEKIVMANPLHVRLIAAGGRKGQTLIIQYRIIPQGRTYPLYDPPHVSIDRKAWSAGDRHLVTRC